MIIFHLLKNPKLWVTVALITVVFASGWTANGWRYKAKIARQEAAIISAYEQQREQYMQKFRKQQEKDQANAEAVSKDLQAYRARYTELQEKLRTAVVTKPDTTCNPFGPDFAKVWNEAR